jgi:hypothetical protein
MHSTARVDVMGLASRATTDRENQRIGRGIETTLTTRANRCVAASSVLCQLIVIPILARAHQPLSICHARLHALNVAFSCLHWTQQLGQQSGDIRVTAT